MGFICSQCGKTHSGLPALARRVPEIWNALAPDQKANGKIDDDLCTMPGGTFFVRCVLKIPVLDGPEDSLEFGVWSSLSETNFYRYVETFSDLDQEKLGSMFGWFSSNQPDFEDALELKCNVVPQNDRRRPIIELEAGDHPLSRAQRTGVSWSFALSYLDKHLGADWHSWPDPGN